MIVSTSLVTVRAVESLCRDDELEPGGLLGLISSTGREGESGFDGNDGSLEDRICAGVGRRHQARSELWTCFPAKSQSSGIPSCFAPASSPLRNLWSDLENLYVVLHELMLIITLHDHDIT